MLLKVKAVQLSFIWHDAHEGLLKFLGLPTYKSLCVIKMVWSDNLLATLFTFK